MTTERHDKTGINKDPDLLIREFADTLLKMRISNKNDNIIFYQEMSRSDRDEALSLLRQIKQHPKIDKEMKVHLENQFIKLDLQHEMGKNFLFVEGQFKSNFGSYSDYLHSREGKLFLKECGEFFKSTGESYKAKACLDWSKPELPPRNTGRNTTADFKTTLNDIKAQEAPNSQDLGDEGPGNIYKL